MRTLYLSSAALTTKPQHLPWQSAVIAETGRADGVPPPYDGRPMTHTPSAQATPTVANRPRIALPLLLWSLLAVTILWRVMLAWSVVSAPVSGVSGLARGLGAVVVHWRQLDGLIGWVALLLWLMGIASGGTVGATSLRQRRIGQMLGMWAGVSLALALIDVASDQFLPGSMAVGNVLGPWSDRILAFLGLVAVVRELHAIASEMPAGQVHLGALWRFLTAQWLLAWLAATVFLGFSMRKEELLGNESARQLLFAIPAFGVLPNVLMLAGIRLWNARMRPGPGTPPTPPHSGSPTTGTPRVRAWLLAMIAATVAGILLVLRTQWLGLLGGPLLLLSVALYLAGFPKGAWGRHKAWLLAAWGMFALAIALATVERLMALGTPALSMAFFGNAWRHLLLGAALLWGLHALAVGAELLSVRQGGAFRLLALATGLCGAGVLLTAGIFLATAFRQGEAQLPVLWLLSWGLLPEAAGVLVVALLLPRLRRWALSH
jgi:hypothetical protein